MALQATAALSMKLFIDTKSDRVLFAEAGKDVVDFLISLLDLPLATTVSLVGPSMLAGSAGSLYCSAEFEALLHHARRPVAAMDPTTSSSSSPAGSLFFMPASSFDPSRIFFRCKSNNAARSGGSIFIKACYLYMTDVAGTRCPNCCNPMTAKLKHVSSVPSLALSPHSDPTFSSPAAPSRLEPSRIFFRCVHQYIGHNCRFRGDGCNLFMADVKGTACPNCDNRMTETLYYVSPAWPDRSGGGGSVQDQEAATYTVGDDLHITQKDPAISSDTLLRRSAAGITDLGAVEERTVPLTYRKGLQILSALLHSKTVLTDVFLFKVRA